MQFDNLYSKGSEPPQLPQCKFAIQWMDRANRKHFRVLPGQCHPFIVLLLGFKRVIFTCYQDASKTRDFLVRGIQLMLITFEGCRAIPEMNVHINYFLLRMYRLNSAIKNEYGA